MKRTLFLTMAILLSTLGLSVDCYAVTPTATAKSKPAVQDPPPPPSIIEEICDSVNIIVITDELADFIILPPEQKKPEVKPTVRDNRNGFRVQVYMGSSSSDRNARIRQVRALYPTYLAGSAPNFKIHAGDFKTRAEAEAAAARIRSRFPAFASEVRVVQARINP